MLGVVIPYLSIATLTSIAWDCACGERYFVIIEKIIISPLCSHYLN